MVLLQLLNDYSKSSAEETNLSFCRIYDKKIMASAVNRFVSFLGKDDG